MPLVYFVCISHLENSDMEFVNCTQASVLIEKGKIETSQLIASKKPGPKIKITKKINARKEKKSCGNQQKLLV